MTPANNPLRELRVFYHFTYQYYWRDQSILVTYLSVIEYCTLVGGLVTPIRGMILDEWHVSGQLTADLSLAHRERNAILRVLFTFRNLT